MYCMWRRGGGPRTDPWGTPVTSWLCFGYLPSPGHLKRPTSEIGLWRGLGGSMRPAMSPSRHGILSTVLRALKSPPFEQIQSVDLRPLTLKTPLLLALPSVKRMGDLAALSVSPSCLEFGPNDSKIILKTKAWLHTQSVLDSVQSADDNSSRALPPSKQDQGWIYCQSMRIYISALRPEQLFVCFGSSTKGSLVTKQRLSRWIIDAPWE